MAAFREPKELKDAFDSPTFGEEGSVYLDKPVGSASISPCGRDVVLASRQGLHIIDLDWPSSVPRHLPHYTPWEVADVQWSPFTARDYWVVSTSNQKALVWNLAMISSQASIEHVLHAHTRAITDINFSAHHPDILATCAVDSFVHCWDLRHPARPAMTFCDWFAGATQVKWNRQDAHILASSHDKFLRIWDDRKGAYPLRSIEAHATKIYGVDWNRTETNNVATCSLDKTIKFWDYTSDRDIPEYTIQTPFPVWRARHTPFGSALLAMPQRGNHNLHLYDRRLHKEMQGNEMMQAVHQFGGHEGQVKEFLWRPRGNITEGMDNREFQLVSWGKDRLLRLHVVSDSILHDVGYEKGMNALNKVNLTRKNAKYKTFREKQTKYGTKSAREASGGGIRPFDREEYGSKSTWAVGIGGSIMKSNYGGVIGGSMRSVGGRGGQRQEMDPISWMKGVKIGKREAMPSGMHQSLTSLFSPGLKSHRIWDIFELGEEITYVGDKFGKVTFDEVDMQNRFVVVSLSGPWGAEGSSTYIKTVIEFPKDYPKEGTPTFNIEKTASMRSEVLPKVVSELQQIVGAYLSRQRNSLEAIVRYLLGEQNLEESLIWLKECPDHTDLDLMQNPELSSSDDDDDEAGQYINSQAQGMELSDGMIAASNAQYNAPLRKTCGALWANNGALVCFFPPRDRTPSLLDLSLKNTDQSSRSHKTLFEGFGRLYNRSLAPKNTSSNLEDIESDGSDSEPYSTSSSGSSSSLDVFGASHHHFIPSSAWRGDASENQHTHSVDESQLSSGGMGLPKLTGSKSANLVSVHDFRELVPSKQVFAQDYIIGGPDCCVHNAEVARRNGDQNLADAWDFVELILQEQVPLHNIQHPHNDESIMLVTQDALSSLSKIDSAVDLSLDTIEKQANVRVQGSVKWGLHPFGRWMVDALFHHYEQLADVQMLGMLSCILSESCGAKSRLVGVELDEQTRPGYSLTGFDSTRRDLQKLRGYFPFEEVARSLLEPNLSERSMLLNTNKNLNISHSANSSVGGSISDPLTPFSGGTPPLIFKPNRSNLERTYSRTTNISASPEQHRHVHRSNSNLANAFTASLARPFSFTASASSSPPATYSRKRSSPAGSFLGAAPPGVTWGSTSFFGKTSTISEDPKPAYSLSASDAEEDTTGPKKPAFTIKLQNQNQFHNDGYADVPLLDADQEWRYRAYREAYAEMLYVWEMPFTSCEILKYNSARALSASPAQGPGPPLIAIGKLPPTSTMPNPRDFMLNIRNHCTSCSMVLPPQSSSPTTCTFCTIPQIPLTCILCASLIRGLASPCLFCGHVLHLSCRAQLLALSPPSIDSDSQLCISGCGCDCAAHAVIAIEYPSRRKSSASMTVTAESAFGDDDDDEQARWRDPAPADEEAREDVAYESLARNLGARFLTPRASQIWRGGK